MDYTKNKIFLGLFFFVITLVGCGGGGINTVLPILTLSQTSASPGAFIVIEDSSIKEGEEIDVNFRNALGFNLTLKTLLTEKGRAKISVPPYFNPITGNIESGTVTVSVKGKRANLKIEGLPELENIQTGEVIKVYLGALLISLNDSLADIKKIELDFEVGGLQALVQKQIDDINTILYELTTFGSFSASSPDSTRSFMLTEEQLKKIDQLLFAMLNGIQNENQSSSVDFISKSLLNSHFKPSAETDITLKNIADGVTRVGNQSRNGISSLTANLKTIVEYGGGPSADSFGALLDVVDGAGRIIIVGVINEVANLIRLADNQAYQPGKGFLNEINKVVNEFVKSNTPWWVETVSTFINQSIKARQAQIKKLCDTQTLTKALEQTCLQWNVYPETHSSISVAKFPGGEGVINEAVKLVFSIGGSAGRKHAKVNEITIDWGEGSESESTNGGIEKFTLDSRMSNVTIFGYMFKTHIYKRPGEYTATITVVGDNDPEKKYIHSLSTNVLIKTNADPLSVIFLQEEDSLETNQYGMWKVEVMGGVPPFDIKMNWDDGKIQKRSNSERRVYKGAHFYTDENLYQIVFDVSDSVDDNASVSSFLSVEDKTSLISWKSQLLCEDVSESNYAQTWRVDLQLKGENVEGNIYFHACPGNGRVSYKLTGIMTNNSNAFSLTGVKESGVGLLDSMSSNVQQFTLTRDLPPIPDITGRSLFQ